MLMTVDVQNEIRRMRGLDHYPHASEAEAELVKMARRARSMDSLKEIVDRWLSRETQAPKPSELLSLILGPDTPKYTPPKPTQCSRCGDSGYEPFWVLRTARAGGAGWHVQHLSEEEYRDLCPKIDWQKQTVYSSVRRCSCPVPADPCIPTEDAGKRGRQGDLMPFDTTDSQRARSGGAE